MANPADFRHSVRVAGGWRAVTGMWVRVSGAWRPVIAGWSRIEGAWRPWVDETSAPPVDPPQPGGTYVLSPTSSYISPWGGGTSYAEFGLSAYRGRITAVKARISWSSKGAMSSDVTGRPSNSYYRGITFNSDFANRTIDHDLYSTAVAQMNAGSASGYNITPVISYYPTEWISSLRLVVTTSS